jgi:hypothetical protein
MARIRPEDSVLDYVRGVFRVGGGDLAQQVLLAVDQHHPARLLVRITAHRFGKGLLDWVLGDWGGTSARRGPGMSFLDDHLVCLPVVGPMQLNRALLRIPVPVPRLLCI